MAKLKRRLARGADGNWQLIYDLEGKEFCVESKSSHGTERFDIDAALKMEGRAPDALRLAIFDLFGAGL